MNLPDMENQKVVTRFAPSPTGFMHIGGVRTALFAWAWARKNAGTFILRIEDTDKEREVPGSIEHIQETLRWLGLEWDFGPDKPGTFGSCIQSERLDTYHAAAKILIDKGLA
jgi:glutamyl-tRNA synthetase